MSGADFTVLGVTFGAVGTALWLRPMLFPGDPAKLSASYLGGNPYQFKASLISTWAGRFAGGWIAVGIILTALGAVPGVVSPGDAHGLVGHWSRLFVLPLLVYFLFVASHKIAHHLGREDFRRKAAGQAITNLEQYIRTIQHNGHQDHDPPSSATPHIRQARIQDAERQIRDDAELLEIRPRAGESIVGYAERMIEELRPYISEGAS